MKEEKNKEIRMKKRKEKRQKNNEKKSSRIDKKRKKEKEQEDEDRRRKTRKGKGGRKDAEDNEDREEKGEEEDDEVRGELGSREPLFSRPVLLHTVTESFEVDQRRFCWLLQPDRTFRWTPQGQTETGTEVTEGKVCGPCSDGITPDT